MNERTPSTSMPVHAPRTEPRLRIAMALYGDLTFDSRVQKEARSLADAGYHVSIVCLASALAPTELPAGVLVLVRRPPGAAIIPGQANPFFSGARGPLRRVMARAAWLVTYVRGLRSWGRRAVAAVGSVDVWHAHDLTGLAAIAPSVPSGVPIVYDSHELFLESGTAAALPALGRRLLQMYERRLVSRATALITVNDEIADVLRHRYRPRSIAVVHNCPALAGPPPPPSRHIRDAAGVPEGSPIVLYHGGLTAGRGIEELMDALQEAGLSDAHLVVMGYGPMRDDLRHEARLGRWHSRLHVLDPVPPSALVSWIAGADVGAMPNPGRTLNDVYSSPNKLFECLAAGTPVVASDLPPMRRIVMDNPGGPLGALCRPGDVGSIADAIASLVRLGATEAMALRDRCRRAAVERWNWEREGRTLLHVYDDVFLRPGDQRDHASSADARDVAERAR